MLFQKIRNKYKTVRIVGRLAIVCGVNEKLVSDTWLALRTGTETWNLSSADDSALILVLLDVKYVNTASTDAYEGSCTCMEQFRQESKKHDEHLGCCLIRGRRLSVCAS